MIKTTKKKVVALDAALLLEWPMNKYFDWTILVTASKKRKVGRLVRNGMSRDLAEKVLGCQMKDRTAMKMADIVIRNNGSLAELRQKSRKVYERITAC